MLPFSLSDFPCVRRVHSFEELAAARFAGSVNALCWERPLAGDFGEVVTRLLATQSDEDITALDEALLLALPVSATGKQAVDQMLADLRLLRDRGLAPELNCIRRYPREESPGIVRTDVYSFHVDSAPIEADTWLCTYHGAASEGLPNADAQRRVDDPATRAELLRIFGGKDDEAFQEFLSENCYDLHYTPVPSARPYAFGLGNLWRIATEHPSSAVLPCIHRAPDNLPGQPRLLLIS
jgi:hypothetical protein